MFKSYELNFNVIDKNLNIALRYDSILYGNKKGKEIDLIG